MAYSDMPMARPEDGIGGESAHEDLYQVGLAYATGTMCEVDYVAAHKWFNLAALAGNQDAKLQRREVADMMSSDELAEALKSAREWLSLMN